MSVDQFKGRRGKRGPKMYGYSKHDVAKWSGMSVSQLEYRVKKSELDLSDFMSVHSWLNELEWKNGVRCPSCGHVSVGSGGLKEWVVTPSSLSRLEFNVEHD